jgi:hypothetical protein
MEKNSSYLVAMTTGCSPKHRVMACLATVTGDLLISCKVNCFIPAARVVQLSSSAIAVGSTRISKLSAKYDTPLS